MKTTSLFLLVSLLLGSCGEDAASKKLASDTEARVTASVKQLLGTTNTNYLTTVHNWYQSDVPNLIKLNPKTESIYQAHAEILQEAKTQEPKLTSNNIVTVEQAQGVRSMYKKLVDESAANVQELSALATSKTSMSEAEQLKYVSDLAEKETHQLALVKYYGKRTAAAIAQKEQKLKHQKYNREVWGHE
ncbi:hypothetical protein [Hymenobacter sp. GOD-10R]|uniref:hypothetical protein n=1 Tax=Hymenobacter sp. GOD-10R TaxID=3093922 RepID=UPI002D78EC7A|nr:hypothetical protein [Hymenobacter sp. GOD-10R]WRQ31957.1 hypothetical protein SD425_29530 [Hymenobacter sp. GOD-10R]